MSPLPRRLRAEARALREAADRILYEVDLVIERVTAMKREADRLIQQADELDEAEQVARCHEGVLGPGMIEELASRRTVLQG